MASTTEISAPYSSHLDEMASIVGSYARSGLSIQERGRLYTALQIFFLNNTAEFIRDFLQAAGMEEYGDKRLLSLPKAEQQEQLVSHLASLKGECVFLLRDSWTLMRQYQENTGKGFGMLVNRHFLEEKDREEDYFALIQPIYQVLGKATDLESFLVDYERRIFSLISGSPHWLDRSRLIAQYAVSRAREKIVWVDVGFQFTFVLFCWASVRYHFPENTPDQDFAMFSAYPWLGKVFDGKYFSGECAGALALEQAGIAAYERSMADKAAGMAVGFAIGDALGFPAAGINRPDLEGMIPLPIRGFASNPRHPYFGHMRPGQYTDNTNTLLLTIEHLVRHDGLDMDSYCGELVAWAATKKPGRVTDRWLGPTAQAAIQRLAGAPTGSSRVPQPPNPAPRSTGCCRWESRTDLSRKRGRNP